MATLEQIRAASLVGWSAFMPVAIEGIGRASEALPEWFPVVESKAEILRWYMQHEPLTGALAAGATAVAYYFATRPGPEATSEEG